MNTDLSTAMAAAQTASVKTPAATSNAKAATKAAQDFEAVFITQMLGQMFSGLSTDGPFGGGQGEAVFRSLMLDEYGKQISAQGGIGLADSVKQQLLKQQESVQ